MSLPVPATFVRCFLRGCLVQICRGVHVPSSWSPYHLILLLENARALFLSVTPSGLSVTHSHCWSYSWLMTKNTSWHLHWPSLGSAFVVSVPQPRTWEHFHFKWLQVLLSPDLVCQTHTRMPQKTAITSVSLFLNQSCWFSKNSHSGGLPGAACVAEGYVTAVLMAWILFSSFST